MTWTPLTFSVGDVNSGSKLTALFNNITAVAVADSGAPSIRFIALSNSDFAQNVGSADAYTYRFGNVIRNEGFENDVPSKSSVDVNLVTSYTSLHLSAHAQVDVPSGTPSSRSAYPLSLTQIRLHSGVGVVDIAWHSEGK